MSLDLEGITKDQKPTVSTLVQEDADHQYIHQLPVEEETLSDGGPPVLAELTSIRSEVSEMAELEPFNQGPDEEWPEGDDIQLTLAMNQASTQLVTEMISKVETALAKNKEKQKALLARQAAIRQAATMKKKIPIQMFLPPYFKDEHGMCPALSEEAKIKRDSTDYDPLAREEKKWNATEVARLKNYVKKEMLDIYIEPLVTKRDQLFNNVRNAGAETPQHQIAAWREEWEQIVRKINYHSEMTIEDLSVTINAENIDWAKMANIDFGGLRTPTSLRLKWFNEVSPRWNQKAWSKDEENKLKNLVEKDMFITWQVVAEKLGTNRTSWQCFEKYKSEIYQNTKPWTPEEDEKLITLCNIIKIGDEIQWDKVSYYMPGRNRQQVRVRYLRSLDKSVKHGKWTDQEDLLLLCAVNRIGARNWKQVASNVPGRTDVQCRERWTSVLDKKSITKEWTLEDDEKLLYLVTKLGRSCWSKFSPFLNRTPDQCRYRFQSLLTMKISQSVKPKPNNRPDSLDDAQKRQVIRKLKLNRIYRKYDNMMASITSNPNEESIDKLMEVVHATAPAYSARRQLDPAIVEVINADLAKITKKYKNNVPVDMPSLLKQIVVLDSDIKFWQKRRASMNTQKKDKVAITDDNRRKRTIHLRKNLREDPAVKELHDKLMESSATEEEKVDRMHEILIDAVKRMDAHEFLIDFNKYWNESGAMIAQDLVTNILTTNVQEEMEAVKNNEKLGFKASMPVNWANSDLLGELQKIRPELMKRAAKLFVRADASIDDPFYQINIMPHMPVDPSSSLHMPLSKEITESEPYLKTKVLLRNAIIEPLIYETACLDAKRLEEMMNLEQHLKERQDDEQQIISGTKTMPDLLSPDELEKRLELAGDQKKISQKLKMAKKSAKRARTSGKKKSQVNENTTSDDDLLLGDEEINILDEDEPLLKIRKSNSKKNAISLEAGQSERLPDEENLNIEELAEAIADNGLNVEDLLEEDLPLARLTEKPEKRVTRASKKAEEQAASSSVAAGTSRPRRKGNPKKKIIEDSD